MTQRPNTNNLAFLRDELQAGSRAYDVQLDLATLPVSRGGLTPDMIEAKVSLAKEILDTDVLHPVLLEAIVMDDGDRFARRAADCHISASKLGELLDKGVVGPGTTDGFVARTPYEGAHPRMTGIDAALETSELYRYVGQSDVGFTWGVPLVSEGFSACHAVVLYDHTARQAAFAHVMSHDWDPGQIETINHIWPHPGERELIYIYGSGSRTDHNEAMAKAVGATRVTTLHVATGATHWALVFDPLGNELSVVRKTPKDVVTYEPFSRDTMDALRDDPVACAMRRQEKVLQAVDQAMRDPSWGTTNVLFGEAELAKLAALVNRMTDEQFSGSSLAEHLVGEGLAAMTETKHGSYVLIPAGFAKGGQDHETRMDEVYARLRPHASATFLRSAEAVGLHRRLTVKHAEELDLYDRYTTVFKRGVEEVSVTTCAKELKFRTDGSLDGPLYHDLLRSAGEIQAERNYRLLFDNGLRGNRLETITPPDARLIEYERRRRAFESDDR